MAKLRILVAVIAYNEEMNIGRVLKDLEKHNFGYDVVVIDNGSSDSTAAVCKKHKVPCVTHCINTGSSVGTVMTYFLYANRYKYDVLCQFDGDGQHVASELKTIVEPIINNRADYVIGSRYLGKDGFKSTAIRRVGIKLFSTLISRLTGLVITDATSGFRAYGDVVIKYFALNYRKEIYDVNQLLLLSHYNGARVTELPVTMKERMHGKSEFDFTNSILFPLKGVINIIGCILEYKTKIRVA
jgi:glycosyltransferase involved in cell wall biosynthesis